MCLCVYVYRYTKVDINMFIKPVCLIWIDEWVILVVSFLHTLVSIVWLRYMYICFQSFFYIMVRTIALYITFGDISRYVLYRSVHIAIRIVSRPTRIVTGLIDTNMYEFIEANQLVRYKYEYKKVFAFKYIVSE